MLKIETAEQALDLVARTLPFARDLRERNERGTIKQMLSTRRFIDAIVPRDKAQRSAFYSALSLRSPVRMRITSVTG